MKKRKIITECKNDQNCYIITVENVRFDVKFDENVVSFLKEFLRNKIFLGFYRTDGINLSFKQERVLQEQIPYLFRKCGKLETYNEYVSVAEVDASDMFYDYAPSIFDYYLDTILFNPKIDWNTFKRYYFDYQNCVYRHFIIKDWCEIVFNYFDSGDFSIYYNPDKYAPEYIRKMVEKYLI